MTSTQKKVTGVTAGVVALAGVALWLNTSSVTVAPVSPGMKELPSFVYPEADTNRTELWAAEVSSNLVDWVTVARNMVRPAGTSGGGSLTVSNGWPRLFARMRLQKGLE